MSDTLNDAPGWVKRYTAHPALPWVLLLALAVWLSALHLAPQGLIERDGYFHARYSQMLPQFGLAREFPWTQESTWKDRFCDKEFLFHVYLIPFTRDAADPLFGARIGTILLDLSIFITLYFVLKKLSVPAPWISCALMACMGGSFWLRLTMIRSHLLSMLLMLLGLYFLSRKNGKALFALGFIYAWSYTVPYVLVMTAIPFWLGTRLVKSEAPWKFSLILACAGGVLLGLVIHPYSPLTFETFLTYLDVARMGIEGKQKASLELGAEIYPVGFKFLVFYPLLILGQILLFIFSNKFREKLAPETLGVWLASLFWLAMSFKFARSAEYAVPVFVFAAALFSRDMWPGWPAFNAWRERRPLGSFTIILLLTLQPLFYGYISLGAIWDLFLRTPPAEFAQSADWMAKTLKPDETVVNLYWDDFPELYYSASRQRYLVGLDPTYMLRFNPEKAELLEEMRAGRKPLDGPKLAQTFNARYMVLRREKQREYRELMDRKKWIPAYEDDFALIFELNPQKPAN